MIFGFYYFSDDPPLENYGGKLNYEKDKQDKYSVNEDDHHDEGSNEEQGDRAPLKEEIKKETIIPLQKD